MEKASRRWRGFEPQQSDGRTVQQHFTPLAENCAYTLSPKSAQSLAQKLLNNTQHAPQNAALVLLLQFMNISKGAR
jgi:hypothetical protein